jgi:hypothetical protein
MSLLGGIFDKEGMVKATIEDCLQNVSEELECLPTELFIMIKPINSEIEFKCWIYKIGVNGSPKLIREIPLKEILGDN